MKNEALLRRAGGEESVQFFGLVDLHLLFDRFGPVALVHEDDRTLAAHGVEDDDDTPVDGLLVQRSAIDDFFAPLDEEPHGVAAIEFGDIPFVAMAAEPCEFAAVLAEGPDALGRLDLRQIVLNGLVNRQAGIGRAIRFRVGLDQPGELGQLRPPRFQGVARVGSDGDLSAISILLKVEIKRAALRTYGLPMYKDQAIKRGSCVPFASRTTGTNCHFPFILRYYLRFSG
ncbi:MAG: hypothetical protein KGM96_03080 [Acidobacteriota bacterium]|nr:hypothetical protein [Acidobacteriota bacterium]